MEFVSRFPRLGPERPPLGPARSQTYTNLLTVPELRGNTLTLLIFHEDYRNLEFLARFLRLGPERPHSPFAPT